VADATFAWVGGWERLGGWDGGAGRATSNHRRPRGAASPAAAAPPPPCVSSATPAGRAAGDSVAPTAPAVAVAGVEPRAAGRSTRRPGSTSRGTHHVPPRPACAVDPPCPGGGGRGGSPDGCQTHAPPQPRARARGVSAAPPGHRRGGRRGAFTRGGEADVQRGPPSVGRDCHPPGRRGPLRLSSGGRGRGGGNEPFRGRLQRVSPCL